MNIFIFVFIPMPLFFYRVGNNIDSVIIAELCITHPKSHANLKGKKDVFILRIGSKKSAHVIKMPNFSSTFAKTFAHFWSKCANFVACFLYTGLTFAVNADYFTRRQFCVLVVLLDQCIVDKISLHTFNFYVTHVNA